MHAVLDQLRKHFMGSSFSQEMNPVVIEPKDKHKGTVSAISTVYFLFGVYNFTVLFSVMRT